MLTVIVPASNEADLIASCIKALLLSTFAVSRNWQLIIVANGCQDDTATIARSFIAEAQNANIELQVLDLERGDKINAINEGEAHAKGEMRVYIDADVVVSPALLDQLVGALTAQKAVYATGTLNIAPPRTWTTRTYARFWSRLPFVVDGAAGCGVFAVNGAGRARWAEFPPVISDDTFVRLHFGPSERVNVPAAFTWPMVEGLANLVRVRRRQDKGVQEIASRYPELIVNEAKSRPSLPRLILTDPFGFGLYALVAFLTKLPGLSSQRWARGR
ncbi:MAG: hypothetical protein ABS75_26900 [Pelagibacterium sp. SCN 63-23]|nr:MAG: hypothetical protein ABS75_26900 [Pelagibacterium sp. SCN 63-23]